MPVAGSPFHPRIISGGIAPGQCTAKGGDLYDGIAGSPIAFTIKARDNFGNECCDAQASGETKFKMAISGSVPASEEFEEVFKKYHAYAESEYKGDGVFEIVWSVDLPGEYTLSVSLDRLPIRGSPFRCFVVSPFVRPPPALRYSEISPAPESIAALVELPNAPVRPRSATLVDGQLVVASSMLQNKNVATRHPSMHLCQFSQQYAFEKKYAAAGHKTLIPACRWRGELMPDYRSDSQAKAVHSLVSENCTVYMVSQTGGAGTFIDRIQSTMVHGGGDARVPSEFSTFAMDGACPKVVEGFALLYTPGVPRVAAPPAEVGEEEGEAEEPPILPPTSAALWLFGGLDTAGEMVGDLYRYDLDEEAWDVLFDGKLQRAPPFANKLLSANSLVDLARVNTAAAADGKHQVWMMGGRSSNGVLSDIHCLDLHTLQWTTPECSGETPTNREKHTLTYCLQRFLAAVGGMNADSSAVNDFALLDLQTMTWQQRRFSPPLQRIGHVAGFSCGSLYLYGGTLGDSAAAASSVIKLTCSDFPQKSALEFANDSSQYMVAKASASLSLAPTFDAKGVQEPTKFSLDCWVWPASFPHYGPAVCKCDGNYKTGFGLVAIDETFAAKLAPKDTEPEFLPNVAFFVGGIANKVLLKLPVAEWSHIACTWDGSTLTAYRNGKRADFINIEVPPEELNIHCNQDLFVGGFPNKHGWHGLVDVVRIWGRCLDCDSVRRLMNVLNVKNDPDVFAQWTISEGAGTVIYDSSQKQNHATLEGGVKRVQCNRDFVAPVMTAAEKHVDSLFLQLREWKMKFEKKEKRQPTQEDMMKAAPEVRNLARRLGLLDD